MSSGRRQLFVYWRVDAASSQAALQAARALQGRLQAEHVGLRSALFLRKDDVKAQATLMETYAVDDAIDAAGVGPVLQQCIESAGNAALARWLCSPRHVEVFEQCDD
jgi:hypothetical protein